MIICLLWKVSFLLGQENIGLLKLQCDAIKTEQGYYHDKHTTHSVYILEKILDYIWSWSILRMQCGVGLWTKNLSTNLSEEDIHQSTVKICTKNSELP